MEILQLELDFGSLEITEILQLELDFGSLEILDRPGLDFASFRA
jgi:hypothetical protein